MTFVPLGAPRFSITDDGDALRIPAARNLFVMAFLPIWLAGWTAGGLSAITTLSHQFSAFLLFWLCAWALGWVFAARAILWMAFGAETLRVINGDLQVTRGALWFSNTKLFRGRDIAQLARVQTVDWFNGRYNMATFGFNGTHGAVRFTYGARSYDLAAGMDDAEARQILDWLKQRLPVKV
jgi:hypothetical protein